jgi:hypothetical protein
MFNIFKKKINILEKISIEKKNEIIEKVKNHNNWINMFKKFNDEEIWLIIIKWYKEQTRKNNKINFSLKNIVNEIINKK